MMKDVDWGRLGTTVPAPIERLLRRCLEKDPENRLQAIGEARIALEEYLADPAAATAAVAPLAVPAQSLWKTAVPWAVAALFALVALAAIWAPRWAAEAPPSSLMRLRVEISPETPLWTANGASAVLSPDGTRLAYVSTAAGARNLYLRNLDQLESTMISGSQDAYSAFFSPDGEWLAFFTPNSLKKVSVFGGTPLTIAEASLNRGGSWAADGTIAYAPSPASGLMQIPDTGGEPRPLTELDTEAGEVTHRWPQVLPGGRAVLFTVHSSGAGFDDARIEVLDLEKNERKVLHHGASFGRYVPTGHVVYVREGTLYALPFDLERLEVTGSPSPLLEDLTAHPNHGSAEFSFSDTGALVYSRGSSTSAQRSLVWVDRSGASSAISADLNSYGTPSLSPDGTRLAVVVGQGDEADIWVHELERGVATRLTFTDKGEWNPIWTPDGASIAFGSARESAGSIYLKPADGSGEAVRLTESESPQAPISWSPDGEVLVYSELGGSQGWNIYTLEPGAGEEPQPFVQTDFDEWGGWFSPDGRWVAYISMESGSPEIYVRPFPGPGGKWQVSKGGGLGPRWSRDGTEIFYRNVNEDRAMVVAVDAGIAAFRSGTPQELFADPFFSGAGGDWDVGLDGQRFLMLEEHGEEGAGLDRTHVILVLDWFEQLRALGASGRR